MEQDKCRVCGGLNLRETVNLGLQPWGNDFRDFGRWRIRRALSPGYDVL